jgi:hypothetical protein
MNSAALSRHLVQLAIGLGLALPIYCAIHQSGAGASIAADAEGLGLALTIIGAIYAVVFAFVIFVIWGQFTDVEKSTAKECSYLNDLLRTGHYLNPDANRVLRRAVGEYAQRVASSEWHSLSERRKDQPSEKAFAHLMTVIFRIDRSNPDEVPIIATLIEIARKAGEQRDERVAQSLTRIPPTLLVLVRVMAGTLLAIEFAYPFHSWVVGMCCFAALAVILFLSNLVMTDTDNPFEGVFNVSAQPFSEIQT